MSFVLGPGRDIGPGSDIWPVDRRRWRYRARNAGPWPVAATLSMAPPGRGWPQMHGRRRRRPLMAEAAVDGPVAVPRPSRPSMAVIG